MSEEKKNQSKKQNRSSAKDDFYDYDREGSARSGARKRLEDTADAKAEKQKKEPNPSSVGNQLAIVLLSVLAIFLVVCYAFADDVGVVGLAIRNGLLGVFGAAAFAVPFLLLQLALFWHRDVRSGAVKYKYIVALCFLVFLAVIVHTFYCLSTGVGKITAGDLVWRNFSVLYDSGKAYDGGGFIGGALALVLLCALGYPGTLIFSFLFLIGFGMALFGLTPSECWQRFMFYRQRSRGVRRARKERAEERRAQREKQEKEQSQARAARTEAGHHHRSDGIDSEIFEDDAQIGGADGSVSEVLYPINIVDGNGKIKLDDIFDKKDDDTVLSHYAGDPDEYEDLTEDIPKKSAQMELVVEKKPVSQKKKMQAAGGAPSAAVPASAPAPKVSEPVRASYQFPPISLLHIEAPKKDTDAAGELRENADKIIQTLDSFNVHVKISNVSRGPTVTRYELEPAAGTRVRSIINLLDDIALSLASSGVRSDGIIAGKSAIGIEVPNKTVNTVYVRELIEDKRFSEAKSKLTTSLGKDVSGEPVYLDIAKMPHLLIAGATGMGKSVCINSLLVSLLYKARPDEVKLILIDPKKVELNIYNGIPHLLVPVVFDPKKAAGSLHWAVTEMERRFELIEAQNTRNIAQYNAAIAGDPAKEFLPQIVIIIDELADLMMSAPDDVEASICRLAQKARAAGMHLIIGTQRPSVDVITGLIKANIPSRIAFTVASQIDSRTIIDMQGAEKLVGRGDMLYAPVGASKPIRVQGSYVSEKEIEDIVTFIKTQAQGCSYSDEIIEQIDKAAEICGQKKGKGSAAMADGGDDGEEEDPMLDSAIELAVESGKISTSLIQRRLSLGYGRAAKLIDVMERRGIVSAPDGQKPRTVLITREQYLEMKMNKGGPTKQAPAAEDGEEDGEDEPAPVREDERERMLRLLKLKYASDTDGDDKGDDAGTFENDDDAPF